MAGFQESLLRAFFATSAHISTSASTNAFSRASPSTTQKGGDELTCIPPSPTILPTTQSNLQCGETMSLSTLCAILSHINNIPGGPRALRSSLQSIELSPGPTGSSQGHPLWLKSPLDMAADKAGIQSPWADLGFGDLLMPTNQPTGSLAAGATTTSSSQQNFMATTLGCADSRTPQAQSSPTTFAPSQSVSPSPSNPTAFGVSSFDTQAPNKSTVQVVSDCPVLKPSHDGHHWRRYGRKLIKDAGHPRFYYKCMDEKCDAKKQMQVVSSKGAGGETQWVTAVTYENDHHKGCTRKDRHLHKMSGALKGALPQAKDKKPLPRRPLDSADAERLEMRDLVAAAPRSDWAKALLGFQMNAVQENGKRDVAPRDCCVSMQSHPMWPDGWSDADAFRKVPSARRQPVQEVVGAKRKAEDDKDGKSGEERAFALKSIRLFGQDVNAF